MIQKFLKKALLFITIYLIIAWIITFIPPYHWGNPWYSTKIQHLEKVKSNYNTFFFGSSRIYHQINPEIFDEQNESAGVQTNSFNLGAQSTFTPQAYYLYENFLESEEGKNVNYAFIELSHVNLQNQVLHEERTTYWQNITDIQFSLSAHYANENITLDKKLKSTFNYLISFVENMGHIGHFGEQMTNESFYEDRFLGRNRDGFLSLDQDLKTSSDPEQINHLTERKLSILEDSSVLTTRLTQVVDQYKYGKGAMDQVHLERILDLIETSRQRGIKLLFILSPRNTGEAIELSRHIPKAHMIDLCDPEKFPEFYSMENSFDVGHLNEKGSAIYSQKLAAEFLNRLMLITESRTHPHPAEKEIFP